MQALQYVHLLARVDVRLTGWGNLLFFFAPGPWHLGIRSCEVGRGLVGQRLQRLRSLPEWNVGSTSLHFAPFSEPSWTDHGSRASKRMGMQRISAHRQKVGSETLAALGMG